MLTLSGLARKNKINVNVLSVKGVVLRGVKEKIYKNYTATDKTKGEKKKMW